MLSLFAEVSEKLVLENNHFFFNLVALLSTLHQFLMYKSHLSVLCLLYIYYYIIIFCYCIVYFVSRFLILCLTRETPISRGIANAYTRVPIHSFQNLKMKNENFGLFSFFILVENLAIHISKFIFHLFHKMIFFDFFYSIFRKKFNVFIFQFSKKMKIKMFQVHFSIFKGTKNEN